MVCPTGGCGSAPCCLFTHLLLCISQAGLELVSHGTGALLVSLHLFPYSMIELFDTVKEEKKSDFMNIYYAK
jgi:hypothetical protein